ncbi:hypothetical protein [Brevibacterium sp. UCMA 11754]|uniref:hypothetical protein n=1 Tax=Brevibacterium sp. UCMA 11754 TaxID=2749198 RepID=UPI001F46AD6D|nr:hypothetical protein [Brevibacterium sp. UCMA 11754]MCF2572779.1 hypothetical protein [Brevibacterium sp. UCMA 11754]
MSSTASTPEGSTLDACQLQAHLHAGEGSGQSQIAEIAEVADPEDLSLEFDSPAPKRHVEPLKDDSPQFVASKPSGDEHGGEDG